MSRIELLIGLLVCCGGTTTTADGGASTPATILNCIERSCCWLDATQPGTVILDGGVLSLWKSPLGSTQTLAGSVAAIPVYVGAAKGITYTPSPFGSLTLGSTRGLLEFGSCDGSVELEYIITSLEASGPAILAATNPLITINDGSDAGARACFGVYPFTFPPPTNAKCLDSPTMAWQDGALHMFAFWQDHERNRKVFMVDGKEQWFEETSLWAGLSLFAIGGQHNRATDASAESLDHVMEGKVSEVFQTLQPVSSRQMTDIKAYLAAKYGIVF